MSATCFPQLCRFPCHTCILVCIEEAFRLAWLLPMVQNGAELDPELLLQRRTKSLCLLVNAALIFFVFCLYLSQFLFLRALQKYSDDYLSSKARTKIDPASGPRLITCRKSNYVRPGYDQRDAENGDFYPDLENDDLFVRKTGASHLNPVVVQDFEYLRNSYKQGPHLEGEIVLQPRDGKPVIPDLEKDDLTVRKVQLQNREVSLSGAPDRYQPALFPDPWSLPPEIQAKFLCLLEKKTTSVNGSGGKILPPSSRQKKDDMLTRKIDLLNVGFNAQPVSFSPGTCSTEDLEKWEAIREASKIKHKKRQMVERSACGPAWIVLVFKSIWKMWMVMIKDSIVCILLCMSWCETSTRLAFYLCVYHPVNPCVDYQSHQLFKCYISEVTGLFVHWTTITPLLNYPTFVPVKDQERSNFSL